MKKCPNCGADIRDGARFCAKCSQPMPAAAPLPANSARDPLADHPTRVLSPQPQIPEADPPPTVAEIARSTAPLNHTLPATRPLPDVPAGFIALPAGALVPQLASPACYQVLEVRAQGPKLNVYLVETLQPVRLCLNSECLENEVEGDFCHICGSKTSEPIPLRYLLKESSETTTFASLAFLHRNKLQHPGLLIYDYFSEIPYGTAARHYVFEPDPGPRLANSFTSPQEAPRVLDWGRQLAEALAYLHSHNLVWRTMTDYHLAIEDKRARWVNFNTVGAQTPDDYQRDVQNLAALLFSLATKLPAYQPGHLPGPAEQVFAQVLGPNPTLTTADALATALAGALAEIRRPVNLRLLVTGQTDVGKVRDHNEDSLMIQEMAWSNKGASHPLGLYVVADGMGGHAAGEVASGAVINTLSQKMAAEVMAQLSDGKLAAEFDPVAWLRESIMAANKIVFDQAKKAGSDMGTTVAAALVVGDTAYIAHVGDSRVYLLNNVEIKQLTVDHSLVERLVATGQITPEEAKTHPQRNVIYRTIGDKAHVEVDVSTHRLAPGESLLLCSDGLSGLVAGDAMWSIVVNSPSLPEACRRLIDAANAMGGDDNITVIIIQLEATEN